MQLVDDVRLVVAVRRGADGDRLVSEHEDLIRRLINSQRLWYDPDAASEARNALLRAALQWPGVGKFRHYASVTIRRALVDLARHRKRTNAMLHRLKASAQVVEFAEAPRTTTRTLDLSVFEGHELRAVQLLLSGKSLKDVGKEVKLSKQDREYIMDTLKELLADVQSLPATDRRIILQGLQRAYGSTRTAETS